MGSARDACRGGAGGARGVRGIGPAGRLGPRGTARDGGGDQGRCGAPAPAPLAWPAAGDCRSLVAAVLALPAAERARLDAASAPLALAVADGPLLLHAGEVPEAVEPDVPVRVADSVDGARCLVIAQRPRRLPGGEDRLVAHEVVRSEFRSGVHRTLNPDYARLQDEAGDEPGRGGLARFVRTGDPVLNLVELAAGSVIHAVGRATSGAGQAQTKLATTDRYVETPTFEPYTYDLTSFEVSRTGETALALVDAASGRVYEARRTLSERRTLAVAKGRSRYDRGLLEGSGPQAVLPEDVDLFESAPPRPRLSELLAALLADGGAGRPGSARDALEHLEPAAGTLAAEPPRQARAAAYHAEPGIRPPPSPRPPRPLSSAGPAWSRWRSRTGRSASAWSTAPARPLPGRGSRPRNSGTRCATSRAAEPAAQPRHGERHPAEKQRRAADRRDEGHGRRCA